AARISPRLLRAAWRRTPAVLRHARAVQLLKRTVSSQGLGPRNPDVDLIRQSGIFDADYYRRTAMNGLDAGLDPIEHYLTVGAAERRDPHPLFSTSYYLDSYTDVALAGTNPLVHYVRHGAAEGRDPHPRFSTRYYVEQNPDVRTSKMNPLQHYIQSGARERRAPSPDRAGAIVGEEIHAAADLASSVPSPVAPPASAFDACVPSNGRGEPLVDVIVPVYGQYAETLSCLHSVLTAPQTTPHEVIVIDDAGPDRALASALDELAARRLITLIRNDRNLGFVASVNRGMALHRGRDVLLLNSDTVVHADWLDRLRRAAHADGAIGTVTPLSNNATICSYPHFVQDNNMLLDVDDPQLDREAARVNAGVAIDIPTAVGFCVYIRRDCLDQVGPFDAERFGRGYGEENDFCLRASE